MQLKRTMNLLGLFAAMAVLASAEGGRVSRKTFNEVDMIRDSAITFIDELWTNVTDNTEWMYNAMKDNGADSAMLLTFKRLCDKADRFVPAPAPESVLENIWNYARIQVELRGIDGLYGNFRKYQQEPAHRHKQFQRAWQDLAETVLQDSDTLVSVDHALENINELIIGNRRRRELSLYELMGEVKYE